jgi:hypothetical protein
MTMPYLDVEGRLRTALTTVILDEYSLLETVRLPLPASERVIAHQLAWRLRTEYERSWDIDVEYNRVGHGTDAATAAPDPEHRPVDISVHHRGMTGRAHNLMVVELKTQGVSDLEAELARLALTARHYDYQYAVLVDLGLEPNENPFGPPMLVWPSWLWLPCGSQFAPVFSDDTVHQLSYDGWKARQRRYPDRDDHDTRREPEGWTGR